MSGNVLDAFDLPLVQAFEYFGGVMAQGYRWAAAYGTLFGLLGLIWSALKVAMSRMTIKDLFWDTTFKWLCYILLLNLYPALVVGFGGIAGEIGMNMGRGKDAIVRELTTMKRSLEKDIANIHNLEIGGEGSEDSSLQTVDDSIDDAFGKQDDYEKFIQKAQNVIPGIKGAYRWSSQDNQNKITEQANEKRNENTGDKTFYQTAILNAINAILVERNLDGENIGTNTDTYISLDVFMKDADGTETFYISPGSMLRMTLLCGNIMNVKNASSYAERNEEIKAQNLNFFESSAENIKSFGQYIIDCIIVWFCVIVLAVCVVFALIQYIMTVLEFTIVAAIGIVFIPCILFDGTKDIPKKLIPVFTSFMVKMIVITLCLMFVFYLLVEFTVNMITSDGFDIVWVLVDVLFNAVLAFILTQNSPKIAQTILTGQPQLSMGEFVAGVGTLGATALGTAMAAKGAAAVGNNAARGAVNGVTNATGFAKKVSGVMSGAKELGGKIGLGKAIGTVAGDGLKSRVKSGLEKWRHGKSSIPGADKVKGVLGGGGSGGSAGGGSSGGGSTLNRQNGQGSTQEHKGETLSTSSNPNFKNATKYDEKTGQQRHMTGKEFREEKFAQGKELGLQVLAKQEAKEKRKAAKAANKGLGSTLTGKTRGEK